MDNKKHETDTVKFAIKPLAAKCYVRVKFPVSVTTFPDFEKKADGMPIVLHP